MLERKSQKALEKPDVHPSAHLPSSNMFRILLGPGLSVFLQAPERYDGSEPGRALGLRHEAIRGLDVEDITMLFQSHRVPCNILRYRVLVGQRRTWFGWHPLGERTLSLRRNDCFTSFGRCVGMLLSVVLCTYLPKPAKTQQKCTFFPFSSSPDNETSEYQQTRTVNLVLRGKRAAVRVARYRCGYSLSLQKLKHLSVWICMEFAFHFILWGMLVIGFTSDIVYEDLCYINFL